jgi:hypothetical protein
MAIKISKSAVLPNAASHSDLPDVVFFEEFADRSDDQYPPYARNLVDLAAKHSMPCIDDGNIVAVLDYRRDNPATYGRARLPVGAIFAGIFMHGKFLARDTAHFSADDVREFAKHVCRPKGAQPQ